METIDKARRLVNKGKNTKALALYDQLLEEDPANVAAMSGKALVLDRMRRTHEAVELGRKAVELAPQDEKVRERLAWLLLGRYQFQESLDMFNALPDSLANRVGRASALLGLNRTTELETLGHAIVAHKPTTAEEWIDRGVFMQLAGRLPEALDAYEEAAELDYDNAVVWLRMAEIYGQMDCVKELGRACDEALAINPRYVEAYTLKARTYSAQGEVRRSEEMSLKAIKADPNSGEAWRARAVVLSGFGRQQEALEAVEKGLSLEPHNVHLIYDHAVLLAALKRYAEAAPILEKLIETEQEVQIYQSLGATYVNLGNGDKALEVYRKAAELFPKDPHAAANQMRVLSMMNRVGDACELGRKVLSEQLENPAFLELFGQLLFKEKLFEEALPVWEALTRILPQHYVAWSNRGSALFELKRFQEALGCHNKAIQLNPHHPLTWVNQGVALKALERFDEAIQSFDQAVARAPEDQRVKELRARCLAQQGHEVSATDERTWLCHLVDKEGEHMVELPTGCYTGKFDAQAALQQFVEELKAKGHKIDERGIVDGEFKAVVGELEASQKL